MKSLVTRAALAPVALVAAATPALAQSADPVADQLTGASLTSYLSSAQGLIVAAVVMLVAFTFLRKAFGK